MLCTFPQAALHFESLIFSLKGNFRLLTIVTVSYRIEYACRLLAQNLDILIKKEVFIDSERIKWRKKINFPV